MNNLKKFRKKKGYSLQALADICGTSKSNLHSLEKGSEPRIFTAYALSSALGVTVYDIWPNNFKAVEETVTRVKSLEVVSSE